MSSRLVNEKSWGFTAFSSWPHRSSVQWLLHFQHHKAVAHCMPSPDPSLPPNLSDQPWNNESSFVRSRSLTEGLAGETMRLWRTRTCVRWGDVDLRYGDRTVSWWSQAQDASHTSLFLTEFLAFRTQAHVGVRFVGPGQRQQQIYAQGRKVRIQES